MRNIPEKWYLKVTNENVTEIDEWRTSGPLSAVEGYILSENQPYKNSKNKGYWVRTKGEIDKLGGSLFTRYIAITTTSGSLFKTYCLNCSVMIISYSKYEIS